MKVSLIVAVDQKNGIGKHQSLPWHLPRDMQFFKETTTGNIVLMGRKNYESIPTKFRPLPNRLNLILTKNKDYTAQDCIIIHSIEEFRIWLEVNKDDPRILFITGGGEIFKQFLDLELVEEMYITHITHNFEADVFFPEFDPSNWQKELVLVQEVDDRNHYRFETYRYWKNINN